MTDTLDAIKYHVAALELLRTGVALDAAHDPEAAAKLAALDYAITALSNQGEGAWIAFADRWPGESVALDDPSVKTRDTVLVTNGINARDRMGRQTNVWLAAPIQSANEVVAFTDSNQKIHGLTHWKPAFGQAESDRRDAEFVRVPREPTDAMLDALRSSEYYCDNCHGIGFNAENGYAKMLDAATQEQT
ncbi:MAG TPA: hypothetical protein VIT62_14590 [Lysobacter sp.]